MKIQWKYFITCLAIPLAVGSVSALLTRNTMRSFESIYKSVLTPPGWVFPIVWTILYILMGIASYLVFISEESNMTALTVYLIQLGFNFFWSIIFFNFHFYFFAFIWLIILWFLILNTIILFYEIDKTAGFLLVPYLLWVTFAGYLNFFIYLTN